MSLRSHSASDPSQPNQNTTTTTIINNTKTLLKKRSKGSRLGSAIRTATSSSSRRSSLSINNHSSTTSNSSSINPNPNPNPNLTPWIDLDLDLLPPLPLSATSLDVGFPIVTNKTKHHQNKSSQLNSSSTSTSTTQRTTSDQDLHQLFRSSSSSNHHHHHHHHLESFDFKVDSDHQSNTTTSYLPPFPQPQPHSSRHHHHHHSQQQQQQQQSISQNINQQQSISSHSHNHQSISHHHINHQHHQSISHNINPQLYMSSPSSSPSSSAFYSPDLNPLQLSSHSTASHLNIPIEPTLSSSSTNTTSKSDHQTRPKQSISISSPSNQSYHPIINLASESHSPHREQHHHQHDRVESNQTTSTTLTSQHPSKTVLTVALAKAQSAVLLDTALQIPEAIEAYTQAVLLLEEVIEKIEELGQERENRELESLLRDQTRDKLWADELWARFSSGDSNGPTERQRQEIEDRLKDRELKWNEKRSKMEKRKKARADEEDRLVGIHNTYAGRIRELEAELAHVNDNPDLAEAIINHQAPGQHSNRDQHFQPTGDVPPLPSHSSRAGVLEQSNHSMTSSKTDSRPNLSQTPSKSSLRQKSPSSSLLPPLSLRETEDQWSSTSTIIPHLDQPNTPQEEFDVLMPQCERRSFGSDSTAREAQSLKHHSISTYRHRTSQSRPSLMRQTTTPITSSHSQSRISATSLEAGDDDEEDETKDIVPDHLINSSTSHSSNLNHTQSSHSKSVRDRSSSSVSGTSVSRLDRMRSNDSMSTSTRTSVSSTAFKPDSTLPPLPQASASTINNASASPEKETQDDHLDPQHKSNTKSSSSSRPKTSESSKTPQTPRRPHTGRSDRSVSIREPNAPLPTQTSSQVSRKNSTKTQTTITLSTGNIQDGEADKPSSNPSSNNKPAITPQPRREPTPLKLETPHKRPHHHSKLSNAGEEVDIDLPSGQDVCSPGTVSIIRSLPSPELPESPRVPTTAPTGSRAVSLIPTIYSRPSNASMMAISVAAPAIPMRLRAYSQPGKRGISNSTNQSLAFPKELQHRAVSNPNHQHLKSLRKSVNQVSSNSLNPPSKHHHHTTAGGSSYAQHPPSVYAHASTSVPFMVGGGNGSSIPPGELPPCPSNPIRRPFHLMRQIRTTILTGAYVSNKLYVPKQMWQQKGVRLNGLESKMKLIELLENGLELFEHDGKGFLNLMKGGSSTGATGTGSSNSNKMNELLGAAERFNKRLESFDEVLDGIESGLVKKLGLGTTTGSKHHHHHHHHGGGKDGESHSSGGAIGGGGTSGFGTDPSSKRFGSGLANKLGKGLDRIAIGRNAGDLVGTYVEVISKLFAHSQIIDAHLSCLGNSIYIDKIGKQNKTSIECKLKRVSEFYSIVVCRFVVADMGILLDKYVKRGGNWCSE